MEIRKATAPHPMDAKPATAKVAKVEAKPVSAAKANKIAKVAKSKPVPARLNAKGDRLRCMVMTGVDQCGNPQRHPVGKGWICSTHNRARGAGKALTIRGKAQIVWIAPHAPIAAK